MAKPAKAKFVKEKMTFDEFCNVCDLFDETTPCGEYFPTYKEFKSKIKPECDLDFILWILQTADEPKNEEQKEVKKELEKLFYSKVTITD